MIDMIEFKPLTPSFRQEINIGFDKTISELQSCEPNGLVNVQIEGLRMWKRFIDKLPDGYLMPIRK